MVRNVKKYKWRKQYGPYMMNTLKKVTDIKIMMERFYAWAIRCKESCWGGYEYEWNGRYHLWRVPKETMQKLHETTNILYK